MTNEHDRPRLLLERLTIRQVRNLVRAELEPAPGINVIAGPNGVGKTTVLEAIYFSATSKSFRTRQLHELILHGETLMSVTSRFREQGTLSVLRREQTAAFGGTRVAVHINGNRPRTLAEFAIHSPVVVFHPAEIGLSTGPALGRRTLLDRVTLFLDPISADHRARYLRAHRLRHQLLRRFGPHRARAELEAFERLCAAHGAAVTQSRAAATAALIPEILAAFGKIAAPNLSLECRYAPGGCADEERARAELANDRERDMHRSSARFGPHRDDLLLLLGGHPARVAASQGQHRVLTLALKAAEAAAVAAIRGAIPILLLDDVSSELDPERTGALFDFLRMSRGQIFLTTTRPELIDTAGSAPADRRHFAVSSGSVRIVR